MTEPKKRKRANLSAGDALRRLAGIPERQVVVLVMENRSGKPHIQCFGESITLHRPVPEMIAMFKRATKKYGATFEVNGKEWVQNDESEVSNGTE